VGNKNVPALPDGRSFAGAAAVLAI